MSKRIKLVISVEINDSVDVHEFLRELDYHVTHPDIAITDMELVHYDLS